MSEPLQADMLAERVRELESVNETLRNEVAELREVIVARTEQLGKLDAYWARLDTMRVR